VAWVTHDARDRLRGVRPASVIADDLRGYGRTQTTLVAQVNTDWAYREGHLGKLLTQLMGGVLHGMPHRRPSVNPRTPCSALSAQIVVTRFVGVSGRLACHFLGVNRRRKVCQPCEP
jgi:hypothetical protein